MTGWRKKREHGWVNNVILQWSPSVNLSYIKGVR
jgi:hypothetical protein